MHRVQIDVYNNGKTTQVLFHKNQISILVDGIETGDEDKWKDIINDIIKISQEDN